MNYALSRLLPVGLPIAIILAYFGWEIMQYEYHATIGDDTVKATSSVIL